MTPLLELKVAKFPRCVKGTSRESYGQMVKTATASRSRAKEVLEGVILEELKE